MLFEKLESISLNNVQFSRTSIRNVRLCTRQSEEEEEEEDDEGKNDGYFYGQKKNAGTEQFDEIDFFSPLH